MHVEYKMQLQKKWIRNKIKEYTWDSFIMEKKVEIGSTKGTQIIWAWNTHLLQKAAGGLGML